MFTSQGLTYHLGSLLFGAVPRLVLSAQQPWPYCRFPSVQIILAIFRGAYMIVSLLESQAGEGPLASAASCT